MLLLSDHPDEQPHNNTIEIDIEVGADDRHDSQMITQDISDDDNDEDANVDEDDDDDDDDDRNHGEYCYCQHLTFLTLLYSLLVFLRGS